MYNILIKSTEKYNVELAFLIKKYFQTLGVPVKFNIDSSPDELLNNINSVMPFIQNDGINIKIENQKVDTLLNNNTISSISDLLPENLSHILNFINYYSNIISDNAFIIKTLNWFNLIIDKYIVLNTAELGLRNPDTNEKIDYNLHNVIIDILNEITIIKEYADIHSGWNETLTTDDVNIICNKMFTYYNIDDIFLDSDLAISIKTIF